MVELQWIEWTKVSSDLTNMTTYKKLSSDEGERRIIQKWPKMESFQIRELSINSSTSKKQKIETGKTLIWTKS